MQIYEKRQSRVEYLETQIRRSQSKFGYCKVSIRDVIKYKDIISSHHPVRELGPILCLGVRNGREVDIFRNIFFGTRPLPWILGRLEKREFGFSARLPRLEALGRSDWGKLCAHSVIGAEINPMARRSDIWVGSFDDMPPEWSGKFSVVYSNSFDQSAMPERTAREWLRVLRPGGYLIFCYAQDAEPTQDDPVGRIEESDVIAMFGGTVVYSARKCSIAGYNEMILKMPT